MTDLTKLSLPELKALKARWYREATEDGTITTITQIARALGTDPAKIDFGPTYVSEHGPKYLFVHGEPGPKAIYVYVDDYGRFMDVHIGGRNDARGGKLVCSTHRTKPLFVQGEWVGILMTYRDEAEASRAVKQADDHDDERSRLIRELSPE